MSDGGASSENLAPFWVREPVSELVRKWANSATFLALQLNRTARAATRSKFVRGLNVARLARILLAYQGTAGVRSYCC